MTNIEKLRIPLEQALLRLDRAMPQVRGLVTTECISDLTSVRLNLVDAIALLNAAVILA